MKAHFTPRADTLLGEWPSSPTWYKTNEAEERGFWRFAAALLEDDRPDQRLGVTEIQGRVMAAVGERWPEMPWAEVCVYNLVVQIGAVYKFLDAQRGLERLA